MGQWRPKCTIHIACAGTDSQSVQGMVPAMETNSSIVKSLASLSS